MLELRDPRLQGKEQTSNHVHPGARETIDNKPYPAPEVKPGADTLANAAPGAVPGATNGAGQAPGSDNPIISDADAKAILDTIAWKPSQSLTPSRNNMIAQLASLHTPSKGYRRPNKTDSRLVQRDSAARAGRIGG